MDTNNECPSGKNFLHFLSVGIIIFDRADPGFPYALAILSLGKLDRCQIGSVQQVSIDDLLGGAALQHPPALKQDASTAQMQHNRHLMTDEQHRTSLPLGNVFHFAQSIPPAG